MTGWPTRRLMLAVLTILIAVAAMYGRARAQVLIPKPEELRFEATLGEPLGTPDRRGVVAGTSAMVVKDRNTGQCYVAITVGQALGLAPATCAK